MFNKALFLDRDGVINKDFHYVYRINDIEFIDHIFDLVKFANQLGFIVIIVTNQAGISRGIFTEKEFIELMEWILSQFKKKKALITDYYYCPYHPNFQNKKYEIFKNDRKPKPGMFLKAKEKYNINMHESILIGDNITDMMAGEKAKLGKLIYFSKTKINKYECISSIKEAFIHLE